MEFLAREEETRELATALASKRFEATLVYGRRRVGKTELIRHALEGVEGALVVSCECKRASATTNLRYLSGKVASALGYPSDYSFPTFDALLASVFSASVDRDVVLVIDEFSFLLKEDPSIDSSLAIAIDENRHRSRLKLVLSGSYVDLMEQLVDADSPLYGRFTHIIRLKPFDYHAASLFYPGYDAEGKMLMYAALGGVPYFNSLADPERPAIENVIDLVVRKDSILEHEISEMLLNETNKVAGLNEIIELVGCGVTKYSDLVARASQEKQARPAYALARLQDMGILWKVEPINAKGNRKRTFYSFADNLVHFYYRYVFRYIAERNTMDPSDFYREFVERDLAETYLPMKFEQVAAQGIARLSKLHRIEPVVYEVGTYWHDDPKAKVNRQFDVVTRDCEGYTSYECKYTSSPIGLNEIAEEERQVLGLDIEFYRLGFISRSGYEDGVADTVNGNHVFLTLSDLYD